MYQITGITSDPLQKLTMILPSGIPLVLTLYFMPQNYAWVIKELDYNSESYVLTNLKIVNSLNMLNQYRNLIPFGLACQVTGGREPQFIQDFVSGAANLYILTQDEVNSYRELLEK